MGYFLHACHRLHLCPPAGGLIVVLPHRMLGGQQHVESLHPVMRAVVLGQGRPAA